MRRDDPFDDIFREIERMMEEMMHGTPEGEAGLQGTAGFGHDTHVDVHETDEEVRVIADLPGVSKADIALKCDGEVLTISAPSDVREYDERVSRPARVDPESGSATYNNGVLEVIFYRIEEATDIDVE